MGVPYGSTSYIPTNSLSNQVGTIPQKPAPTKSGGGFLSILRIVVVVAEVVASIGVSLLTAGAAAPEAGALVATELTVDGAAEGAVEGITEGAVEGISEGAVDGTIDGGSVGATTDTVDGISAKEVGSFALPKIFSRTQGVIAQTGIALGGASSNLGLSVAEGDINAVYTGIDFASALLPGLSELTSGFKNVMKANRVVRRISKGEAAAAFVEQASADVAASTATRLGQADILSTVANQSIKNESIDIVKEIATLGLSEGELNAIVRYAGEEGITADNIGTLATRIAQEAGIEQDIAMVKLSKISKLSDNVDKLNIGFNTTKTNLINQIQDLTGLEQQELVKSIWFTGRPNPQVQSFLFDDALTRISTEIVNDDARNMWLAIVRKAKVGRYSDIVKEFPLMINAIRAISPEDAKLFENGQQLLEAFLLSNGKYQSTAAKFTRFFGSKKFNDYVVQPTQAIFDPGDLGRAPVEFIYRRAKAKIEKIITAQALKKGEKLLAKFNNIEETMIAAGWKPMRGRYLWMMKVLPGGTPLTRLAIMKFRPDTTATSSGINKGGKPDVMIRLSDKDIERLEVEGSAYWWSQKGRRKGWWYSRGGRRFSGISNQLSTGLSLFLGFIPINALRLWLSITSNVVENVNDMFQGNYTGTYVARLERSFIRSALNRSVRLGSRVVIGGAATKLTNANSGKLAQFLFGKAFKNGIVRSGFLGREMQRFGVAAMQSIESVGSDGKFKFKTYGSLKRIQSKSLLGGTTSVRSNLVRYARRKGIRGGAIGHISGNRKFSQVRRVGSAVTPNNVFNSRSFGNIKL